MGYFNRDDRRPGRRNFGRRDFGGRGMDRQMHKAICSSCGKECEVPFKPSGEKPVYCNNCFEKNRGGSDTRRFTERNLQKPHFEDRNNRSSQNNEQFNTLNAKLDKILAMLASGSNAKVISTPKPQDLLLPAEVPVKVVEKKKKSPKKVVVPPEALE